MRARHASAAHRKEAIAKEVLGAAGSVLSASKSRADKVAAAAATKLAAAASKLEAAQMAQAAMRNKAVAAEAKKVEKAVVAEALAEGEQKAARHSETEAEVAELKKLTSKLLKERAGLEGKLRAAEVSLRQTDRYSKELASARKQELASALLQQPPAEDHSMRRKQRKEKHRVHEAVSKFADLTSGIWTDPDGAPANGDPRGAANVELLPTAYRYPDSVSPSPQPQSALSQAIRQEPKEQLVHQLARPQSKPPPASLPPLLPANVQQQQQAEMMQRVVDGMVRMGCTNATNDYIVASDEEAAMAKLASARDRVLFAAKEMREAELKVSMVDSLEDSVATGPWSNGTAHRAPMAEARALRILAQRDFDAAVADEQRAEARLIATKAKATLKIKAPYIAKHDHVNHEAKRKAAMEEELWRHKQMVTKVREEDFKQEQTSFAETLTSEQADAMESEAWAVAQEAAHRALRASQKAELRRVDLEATEGSRLEDKASCQIVTAQTVVDAWRDALLKVKATRARTGGGWRADVAGRTKQTSARLLEAQPLDEQQLRAALSPREQRLQRIVHEVGVFTMEQGRLQEVYEDSLKHRAPADPDFLSRLSPAEVERNLRDHKQQLTMRKAVLAMAEAQAALNDAKATRLASAWHGGGGVLAESPESLVQRAAAAAEEACFTAYQAVDELEAVATDESAWRHRSDEAHAAWNQYSAQLVHRHAKAQRQKQLAELRSWTKAAYGKVTHAIRAENQALSWLSNGSNVTRGNLSHLTTSAQVVASMSAQAAALKPILEVLGNRSANRRTVLSTNKATVGLAGAAGEAAQDPNPHERLGEHELSELEKAQRLVGQAEKDQQAALAALTIARKADEHGSQLASQQKSTQLKEVQQVLRNHATARQVVANYTRDRAAKIHTTLQEQEDDDPPIPCTDMPCAAAALPLPDPFESVYEREASSLDADADESAFNEEKEDDDPTPCTDFPCEKDDGDDPEPIPCTLGMPCPDGAGGEGLSPEDDEPEPIPCTLGMPCPEDADLENHPKADIDKEEDADDEKDAQEQEKGEEKAEQDEQEDATDEEDEQQLVPEEDEEDEEDEEWKWSATSFAGKAAEKAWGNPLSSRQQNSSRAAREAASARNGTAVPRTRVTRGETPAEKIERETAEAREAAEDAIDAATSTGLRKKETAPAVQSEPSTVSRQEDAAAVAVKAKEEAEAAGMAAKDAAEAEAQATRTAEAAAKAAEAAKANAFAADEEAKAKVAAEEAANAEKAAAAAKAEADALKAQAKKDSVVASPVPVVWADVPAAQGIAPKMTPPNATDVVPGSDTATTEYQPDSTPSPSPSWSGWHTAIFLISITISLFLGYFLAFVYRRLSDGKKARMTEEGTVQS
jgi:hypothetical protein